MRSVWQVLKSLTYYSMLIWVCFEIALWIAGYRPYRNQDYTIEANPKSAFVGDSLYGIVANEGNYTITLNGKVTFHATHLENGHRQIRSNKNKNSLPQIAFLGCSFTYGYGVNDEETFTALLQKELDDFEILNYATPGHGTVQSYLKLSEMLQKEAPKAVFLVFSDLHYMRNTLSQEFRSNLKIGFKNSSDDVEARMKKARFPFFRDTTLQLEYQDWANIYTNWTLREYLASANWLQNNMDTYKDWKLNSLLVTEKLIKKMEHMCQKNGVEFGVICLDNSPDNEILQQELAPINWKSVHFKFDSTKLTNLPYDSHPNAAGHLMIAKRILPFVREIVKQNE